MLNSVILNRLFFVFPIINLYNNIVMVLKERKIFIDELNNNDAFFTSIATLGFLPHKYIKGVFYNKFPFEPGLTLGEIQDISKRSIIGVVMQFAKDHDLLGIIMVESDIVGNSVITVIRPATLPTIKINLIDLLYSLIPIIFGVVCVQLWFN